MGRYFESAHLPEHLRTISQNFEVLYIHLMATLPASAEKTAGVRKLLEAKDCFVRAALPPKE